MEKEFEIIKEIQNWRDIGFRAMRNKDDKLFNKCLEKNSELQEELRKLKNKRG